MDTDPHLHFIGAPPGEWHFVADSLPALNFALGEDTMAAFCQLFLWSDRLTSVDSLFLANQHHYGPGAIAFKRNLHSLVWFMVGCLHEMAHAIQHCRSQLRLRNLLNTREESWVKLDELEKRWKRDDSFRKMRDKLAFHFDRAVALRGVQELAKSQPNITLAHGDGSAELLSIGHLSMFAGIRLSEEQYGNFLKQAVADSKGVPTFVRRAFLSALKAAGVPIAEEENGEGKGVGVVPSS